MAGLGETLVGSLYATLPDARASVAYDGETVAQAVCVGINEAWQDTEQGAALANVATVRYAEAHEPAAWGGRAIIGKVVAVTLAGGDEYRARVMGRALVMGAVRLTISAEYEQQ